MTIRIDFLLEKKIQGTLSEAMRGPESPVIVRRVSNMGDSIWYHIREVVNSVNARVGIKG